MAGPEPLTFPEIEAWARLRGLDLDGWELDALLRMDGACRTAAAGPAKPDAKPPSAKAIRRAFEMMAGKKKRREATHG